MQAPDVIKFVKRRPFEPFRLTLTDGRTYDVHHPELIMVGVSAVTVGRPARVDDFDFPVFDRSVEVSMNHIMQIERLASSAAQASP